MNLKSRMGLHAVSGFIKKKYPHLLHKEHISLVAYERVFVDIASYIYKYVCIGGSESSRWLNSLLNLILMFRRNRVNIITVFDFRVVIIFTRNLFVCVIIY